MGSLLLISISILVLYGYIESMYRIDHDTFIITRYKTKNWLYRCEGCEKLYRHYQEALYVTVNNKKKDKYCYHCPHCKRSQTLYSFEVKSRRIDNQPKWAHTHPDCPKINMFQHMKIKRTARQILHNQKLLKDQEFFEEYNKVKVDFSWINNIKDSVR